MKTSEQSNFINYNIKGKWRDILLSPFLCLQLKLFHEILKYHILFVGEKNKNQKTENLDASFQSTFNSLQLVQFERALQ